MDIIKKETRSKLMASVKSRGNKTTELKMVSLLKKSNLNGWRRHLKLPGTPDFCWPQKKIALFVDGCFWHGCPYTKPATNISFWKNKIIANKARDKRVNLKLRSMGWSVIRVWECKLSKPGILLKIKKKLNGR